MIGPWQHRVHMRNSFTSMSAAVRSLKCADPLSRSQRSLIWADTERCNSRPRARRTVLATFGKLLRFVQKSLDSSQGALKKKSLKGSEKSLNWQHCPGNNTVTLPSSHTTDSLPRCEDGKKLGVKPYNARQGKARQVYLYSTFHTHW